MEQDFLNPINHMLTIPCVHMKEGRICTPRSVKLFSYKCKNYDQLAKLKRMIFKRIQVDEKFIS